MTVEPRLDVPGTYVVVSGDKRYNVDLRDHPTCDCPSHCWTDALCKHIRLAQASA